MEANLTHLSPYYFLKVVISKSLEFPNAQKLLRHPVKSDTRDPFLSKSGRMDEAASNRGFGETWPRHEAAAAPLATFGERNEMARLNCHALKNE